MKHAYLVDRISRLNLQRRLFLQKNNAVPGLNPGQFYILNYLLKHPKCTQIEIADSLHVTPAAITCATKRMQADGFIDKTPDPENLRCNRLSITDRGHEIAQTLCYNFDIMDEKMLEGISKQEVEQLIKTLDKMIANLSQEAPSTENCNAELVSCTFRPLPATEEV